MEVELGPVEGGLTRGLNQFEVLITQYLVGGGPQGVLVSFPVLGGSEVGVGVVAHGQPDVVDRQPEDVLGLERGAERCRDFVLHLVGSAEDVGVVEVDLAHPL